MSGVAVVMEVAVDSLGMCAHCLFVSLCAVLRAVLSTCSEGVVSGIQQCTHICGHSQLLVGACGDGLGDSQVIDAPANVTGH